MKIPDEVKQLARAGKDKKIHAIHALRKATGLGLAEAKEYVEIIAAGGEVQLSDPAPETPGNEAPGKCLEQQIAAMGRDARRSSIINKATVREKLLEILQANEDLLDLAQATYDDCSGVLVFTRNRLIFLSERMSFGTNVDKALKCFGITPVWGNMQAVPVMELKAEFPLHSIYLIYLRAGLYESSVKIFISGYNRAEFWNMNADAGKAIAEGLRELVEFRTAEIGDLGPEEHLEQREAEWQLGAISNEELAAFRRKILKQIRQLAPQPPAGKRRLS